MTPQERYAAHREKELERKRKFYAENRDAMRARDRRQYEKDPKVFADKVRLRRERIRACGVRVTAAEWRSIQEAHGHACVYCGATGVRLTRDHKVPLARGGLDNVENVVPACRPCNQRKHAKTAAEFTNGRIV